MARQYMPKIFDDPHKNLPPPPPPTYLMHGPLIKSGPKIFQNQPPEVFCKKIFS